MPVEALTDAYREQYMYVWIALVQNVQSMHGLSSQ